MKYKEIFIYILLFLLIIFSFVMPKFISKIGGEKIFSKAYVADKKLQTLSQNAQIVDLVDVIYSKYKNSAKYNVKVSDDSQQINKILQIKNKVITILNDTNILNKVKELVDYNIIKDDFFEDLVEEKTIIFRIRDYDNDEITYSKIKIFTNRDSFQRAIANIEVENVTNKIISFSFEKKYLDINQGNLESYVQYLKLDSFHDWEYKNNELKSKQSRVKITTTEENGYVSFQLIPLE